MKMTYERGTGYTSKMLLQATNKFLEGKDVIVVLHRADHARDVCRIALDMLHSLRLPFTYSHNKKEIKLDTKEHNLGNFEGRLRFVSKSKYEDPSFRGMYRQAEIFKDNSLLGH